MRTRIIKFISASALVVTLMVGLTIVRPASAQVAATSTGSGDASTSQTDVIGSSTDASSTPPTKDVSTSTPLVPTTPADATTTAASNLGASATSMPAQKKPIEAAPAGLTEVHIIGTKYIDYFTDGSTTIPVPGDPVIDGHLSDPGAPLPTHEGMTWVHTTGRSLYDTPSGDLEVGDYAVQADGSYIENAPPLVSSTSTPTQLTTTAGSPAPDPSVATSSGASPASPDASISTAPASDNSRSTTSSEPATPPNI